MLFYGIMITKDEYNNIMNYDIQSLFKNKITSFDYKENIFLGFSLSKMLINPQIEFNDLSLISTKYLKKPCVFYDL